MVWQKGCRGDQGNEAYEENQNQHFEAFHDEYKVFLFWKISCLKAITALETLWSLNAPWHWICANCPSRFCIKNKFYQQPAEDRQRAEPFEYWCGDEWFWALVPWTVVPVMPMVVKLWLTLMPTDTTWVLQSSSIALYYISLLIGSNKKSKCKQQRSSSWATNYHKPSTTFLY